MNIVTRAKAFLAQDTAENSIMQTISIAVSAILIAAGLITAPALINNARDTNVKSDLANVSYSQEFSNSVKGVYAPVTTQAELTSFLAGAGAATPEEGNVKTTLSSGSKIWVGLDAPKGYIAIIQSQTGNIFVRNGISATTTKYTTLAAAVTGAGFATAPTLTAASLITVP